MIPLENRFVRAAEAWFDEPIVEPTPDLVVRRHSSSALLAEGRIKLSLVTDLTVPENDILMALDPECRRKVRRAQERSLTLDPVHPVRDDRELIAFLEFYNGFAADKRIDGVPLEYLRGIAGQQRLWLSAISDEEGTLVRHAYIVTGGTTRHLYGAAMFRHLDNAQRRKVSLAHSLLHWDDLVGFRNAGFRTYDWGGLFADESTHDTKGINDFKRQFGGTPISYREGEEALTLRGRLYLGLHPIADSLRALLQAATRRLRDAVGPRPAPGAQPELPPGTHPGLPAA